MVMITCRIEDHGLQESLDNLQRRIWNMKPVLTRIGAMYERRVLENFKREESPDGKPWQRLSAATMLLGLHRKKGFKKNGGLSARSKRYITSKKILRESGDLEGSIHFQAGYNKVAIGSSGSIPYAAIQQFGGKAGRGHKVTIPARPWLAVNRGGELELSERDRSWIMETIRDELLESE